jgi:hypothetical protein
VWLEQADAGWNDLLALDAGKLETILGRGAPFGRQVLEEASSLPRFAVSIR